MLLGTEGNGSGAILLSALRSPTSLTSRSSEPSTVRGGGRLRTGAEHSPQSRTGSKWAEQTLRIGVLQTDADERLAQDWLRTHTYPQED